MNTTTPTNERMKMTTEQILAKIEWLSTDELTATNDGTHDRDPQYCTWYTYERLDGSRYTVGNRDSGAGYTRWLKYRSASERREQIAALQQSLKSSKSEAAIRESRRADLARGWAGYQFIGIEEGMRRLAAMGD